MDVRPGAPRSAGAVAIVTGGASEAGRAAVRELARRGFAIVVVYLRDQGGADALVEAVLAARGAAMTVRADVTDPVDVERLIDETLDAFGGVDLVVHALRPGAPVLDREAARRLRPGGAIVGVPELIAQLDRRGT